MAVTLSQLEDIFYGILREEGPTTAYPQTLADLYLNSAQDDICSGRVIHPYTGAEARKGILHFLNTEVYYSNVKTTYTTADCVIGGTTIDADTTFYPTTGNLLIGSQIVTYTGTTATQFTGVTGLLFAYPSGTQISIAFTLPTDFGSTIHVTYNNKLMVPAKQFDDIFEDLNSFKGSNFMRSKMTSYYESPYRVKPFYTIKDSAYLILYQLNDTGFSIRLRYEKVAPEMTSLVNCTIDNDTKAKMTIPFLAVANMLFERGEEDRAGQLYNHAIAEIKKMYSRYNDTSMESQNNTQYRIAKSRTNI